MKNPSPRNFPTVDRASLSDHGPHDADPENLSGSSCSGPEPLVDRKRCTDPHRSPASNYEAVAGHRVQAAREVFRYPNDAKGTGT